MFGKMFNLVTSSKFSKTGFGTTGALNGKSTFSQKKNSPKRQEPDTKTTRPYYKDKKKWIDWSFQPYWRKVEYSNSNQSPNNQIAVSTGCYLCLCISKKKAEKTSDANSPISKQNGQKLSDANPPISVLQYRLYQYLANLGEAPKADGNADVKAKDDKADGNADVKAKDDKANGEPDFKSYYYEANTMATELAKKTDVKGPDQTTQAGTLFGQATEKDVDFSQVFTTTATNSFQIPTAEQYFVPLKKAQLQSNEEQIGPSKAQTAAASSIQRPSGSAKGAEEQYLVSASITRDYDYLFQSTSTSTINFTPIEQEGINIDHNQLRLSQPQSTATLNHTQLYTEQDNENLEKNMKFRIIREGYGLIDLLSFIPKNHKEIIDKEKKAEDWEYLMTENFKKIFKFENKSIILHKKHAQKFNFQLENQPAIITLENIVPAGKYSTSDAIREQLMEDCRNQNLSFVNYNEETKQFVFLTPGFENCPFTFLS